MPWHRSDIEVYQPPQSSPVLRLSADEISYETPLFSPDGQWMAYVEEIQDPDSDQYKGQARLHLVSTDWLMDKPLTEWFEIFFSSAWLLPHSWSPNSQWLAFRHTSKWEFDRMYIVNVETGKVRLVGEPVRHMAWSDHDSTLLAYSLGASSDEPGLYITTVDKLDHIQKVDLNGLSKETSVTSVVWNPMGTQLALCTYTHGETLSAEDDRTELWLVDVATLSGQRIYSDTLQCGGFAWSADSLWLASCDYGWGKYGTIFYKTANDWTLAGQPVKGKGFALLGRWVGNLFLYTEMTNPEGDLSSGRNIFYQLVATSPNEMEKTILWHPQDADLFSHMKESRLSFFGMSWYATARP